MFLSLVLAVACASFASANAQSSASADSYAILDTTDSGADITFSVYSSFQDTDLEPSSYGLSADITYGLFDGATSNYSYGYSGAFSTAGGSLDQNAEEGATYFLLTNNSSTTGEYAYIYFFDQESSAALGDGYGTGEADAFSELYNYATGEDLNSYADSESGQGIDAWDQTGFFEYYNGYIDAGTDTTYFGTNAESSGYDDWEGDYVTYLAPGQTEELVNFEETYHYAVTAQAQNSTPSPAAMVPFALGLIARRRRS